MYDELVAFLKNSARADLRTAPTVRFKRKLLARLCERHDQVAHTDVPLARIPRSTLECLVASMLVELPATMSDAQIDELATLYAKVVEQLCDAADSVGYTDLDAAVLCQVAELSLELRE